jgi:hypothetical protein
VADRFRQVKASGKSRDHCTGQYVDRGEVALGSDGEGRRGRSGNGSGAG